MLNQRSPRPRLLATTPTPARPHRRRAVTPFERALWAVLWLFLAAFTGLNAASETTNPPPRLSLETIFSSPEFDAEGAGAFTWDKTKPFYLGFETSTNKGGGRDWVRYDPATGAREVLVPAHWFIPPGEGQPLSVEGCEPSDDGSRLLLFTQSKRVWRTRSRGDYWVLDLTSRELHKLGGDAPPSTLMFATFSPDGQRVAFVREHNLYAQDLRDWRVTALTTNGSPTLINGTFDWVYEEELDLRHGFRWSPDSQSIAYWQLDTEGVRDFFLINNTDGLYSRPIPIPYPKAGERNAAGRIGIVSAQGGDTRWLALPGDPREHYVARLDWSPHGLVLQQFNRLQSTNRVFLADPVTAAVEPVLTESDAAWVENDNAFRWVGKGRALLWLSERDGWRHVYGVSRSGKRVACLTPGDFDVQGLEAVDEAEGWFYFLASPTNATQQYLYRARLRGGHVQRVTPPDQPGTHSYQISADAQWAFHTYSTANRPPTHDLIRLPDHRVVKAFKDNLKLREKLAALKPCTQDFFKVTLGQGVELDAWRLLPPDFNPSLKYPVLFHVYGEPAGQTVLDRWQGRGQLWHRLLAQEGYIVMSVDNRGTPAPKGRDWRKSVHRRVGIQAPEEQAAALRTIARNWSFVDTNRVAIWGWSGGGSMTLNAILKYPEVYQTALAVAPVPNQRYYDSIYQERYMGLPSDNPDGYRNGSAVNFAHQLRGNLLIVHGTGDDNCHYQGVEALVNELVRHNKPFTLMAYPNRSHSISEGVNTTRHLYELLTRFLLTHTPPGGQPAACPSRPPAQRVATADLPTAQR